MLMTETEKFQKPPPRPTFTITQSLQQFNQNFHHQLLHIKQEFPEVPLIDSPLDDDLEDIDFKGIENLVKQVDQPLTPEVLNFDEVQPFPPPYQFLQQFPSTSGGQNYPAYFYNPHWMS